MEVEKTFAESARFECEITDADVKKAIIIVFTTQYYPVLKQGLMTAAGMKDDDSNYVNQVYALFSSGIPFPHRNQLIELAYDLSQDSQETKSTMPSELSKCITRPIGLDCGGTPTARRYPSDSAPSSCDISNALSS